MPLSHGPAASGTLKHRDGGHPRPPTLQAVRPCGIQVGPISSDRDFDLRCERWLAVLLMLAVAWRLLRMLLNMPMWGDEAMLDLSLMNWRHWSGVFQPLTYTQVGPPLFLLAEWVLQHVLGPSEFAVRLLPLAAGLAAVVLFWRWSRLLLPPFAALLAVGFFALGYYPMRHSVEMKPYSLDQFSALCLYYLGTLWILQPQRTRYLLAAAILMPLLFGWSYPVVFVAGGLCAAVGIELLTNRVAARRANWLAMVLCGAIAVASFVAVLQITGAGQYHQTGPAMRAYWRGSFPPHQPLRFLAWLIQIHTGNMFAYPVGGKNGGSTATLLVFLVGLAVVFRRRRRLLVLLLAPFALTFIAALMQRYPYGGSARVAQHLAPVICLLAGTGIAWLVERLVHRPDHLRAAPWIAGGLLATVGMVGMVRDIVHPYKTPADENARSIVAGLFKPGQPADRIIVLQPKAQTPVNFQLYLRWYGRGRVRWNGQADRTWTAAPARQLIVVNFDSHLARRGILTGAKAASWQVTGWKQWEVQIGPRQGGPTFVQAIYLIRRPPPKSTP